MSEDIIVQSGELRMFLLILTIVAFLIYISGKKLGLKKAIVLISIYFVFLLYIIGRSYDLEFTTTFAEFLNKIVELIAIQWI